MNDHLINLRDKINIGDYDYDLPEGLIAQHPSEQRDLSKLLIYNGRISSDIFRNIDRYISKDSLLIFNDTRVIRARLLFKKASGAGIEILSLEPLKPPVYALSFGSKDPVEWKCIVGNLKKWKKGPLSMVFSRDSTEYILSAEKIRAEGETSIIRFSWQPHDITFGEIIEAAGHIPLPPYIKREDEPEDYKRYQTVYSKISGSVAAPTAGLHFTPAILDRLRKKGIGSCRLTLHIGAGTFRPVKSREISDHIMHYEHFFINYDDLQKVLRFGENIIAVGTTSVRTLESLYWLGVRIIKNDTVNLSEVVIDQWEPYEENSEIPFTDSFETLLAMMKKNNMTFLHGSTGLIIIPGYRFRVINGMITNFHQPKSTLLLLVSAWVRQDWKKIYKYAKDNNFRFLSYGDSSLLLPSEKAH